MNVFDFVNAINLTKKNIFEETPEAEKEYVPFIVNRSLSYFPDTIMYANEMNKYNFLDKDIQFNFLLNSVTKKKRFSKWSKKDKEPKELQIIKDYYGFSSEKAEQVIHLFDKEKLAMIEEKLYKGGNK